MQSIGLNFRIYFANIKREISLPQLFRRFLTHKALKTAFFVLKISIEYNQITKIRERILGNPRRLTSRKPTFDIIEQIKNREKIF